MSRLVALLLLFLEAVVALVPAQGLLVCLGTIGVPAADEVVAACDCGHHVDVPEPSEPSEPSEPLEPSEPSDAPGPRPGQPDGDCDGCLDLEFDRTEALRPQLGGPGAGQSSDAALYVLQALPLHRGPRPDLARAPALRRLPPPRTARVLFERATVQLRL